MAAEYNTEEIKCPQINSIQTTENKYLCNSQWPRYACYNEEDRLCYNIDGVQSLDPIGDLLYVLNELICRLQSTLLTESEKSIDSNMTEEQKLRSLEMLNSYWSYFGSSLKCPEIVLQADNLRYMEDYLDYTKQVIDRVKILFSKKKGGKKNKKTKRIMKNKRKKTKRKHTKNKKTMKNYKKV